MKPFDLPNPSSPLCLSPRGPGPGPESTSTETQGGGRQKVPARSRGRAHARTCVGTARTDVRVGREREGFHLEQRHVGGLS